MDWCHPWRSAFESTDWADNGEHMKRIQCRHVAFQFKIPENVSLIRDNGPNSLAWQRKPFVIWAHLPDLQNLPAPLQTSQPILPTSELCHTSSLWRKLLPPLGAPTPTAFERHSSISLCEAFPESSKPHFVMTAPHALLCHCPFSL